MKRYYIEKSPKGYTTYFGASAFPNRKAPHILHMATGPGGCNISVPKNPTPEQAMRIARQLHKHLSTVVQTSQRTEGARP